MTRRYEYGALRPVSFRTMPEGLIEVRSDPRYPHGVGVYDRWLRRAEVEQFDLEPLDPADPINVVRRGNLFREHVYRIFTEKDHYKARMRHGGWVTLTWSTRPGVEFQVTFWDEDMQPTGHLDVQDFDDAVRSLSGLVDSEEKDRALGMRQNPRRDRFELVFSYGSNHPAQLAERVRRDDIETRGALVEGWQRVFRERS